MQIGVLVNGAFSIIDKAFMAQQLGLQTVRENIVLSQFTGIEKSWDIYKDNGIASFICNLNWQQGINYYPNLSVYAASIEKVLTSKYNYADVYVLQNEELNPDFNEFSAIEYVMMLAAAQPVFKKYGKKMANGGIYGNILFMLTYRWLVANKGQQTADKFATDAKLTNGQKKTATGYPTAKMQDMQTVIDGIKDYCDYCNVHFYIDPVDGITSQNVWPRVKGYLEQYTGKPVMSNETCIRNSDDPQYVTDTVATYNETYTTPLVWFSGDSNMAGGRSLFNTDGSLRNSGTAFINATKNIL